MHRGRADKKTQVAPYVPEWQRELVHDIGKFLRLGSDGEAGCQLVMMAANDVPTINRLSPYFWRTYIRGTVTWPGHNNIDNLDELVKWANERTGRLKMRFTIEQQDVLDGFAFALARPVSHVAGALLTLATRDTRVIRNVAPGFLARSPYSLKRGFYQWGG